MSLLYQYGSGGGDDGWRPDTAQSHSVEQPERERRALATKERSLPSRAMNRMIDHLVERKAVLTKMFIEYDRDNSGTIDAQELNAALTDLGLRLTPEEIGAIMSRLDTDGGGDIDLEEFIEHFKKARAERFDGHIPELKQAKKELLRKLRTHAPLEIDGGAGLYRMLVQIERLQALEHLTSDQVAQLRAQVVDLLKNGMSPGTMETQELQASIRRHALPAFQQSQKYSSGRWDENHPKPWKVGSHEIKGPRMEMARSRKRLSTAEWQRRSTEVKLGQLDAGKHRSEPKRPWDTRQARHAFATESGQTAITLAKPRARNAEWAPNGLLEDDPPRDPSAGAYRQPAQRSPPQVAAAPKATRKSKSGRYSPGSRGTLESVSQSGGLGTYGGELPSVGESKSMPHLDPLPALMDGAGRPPLGYSPAQPAADPWTSARFSLGGSSEQDYVQNRQRNSQKCLLTDARGFEDPRFGYSLGQYASVCSCLSVCLSVCLRVSLCCTLAEQVRHHHRRWTKPCPCPDFAADGAARPSN